MFRTWNRIRTNFFTGLALLLPIVFSVLVIVWLFNRVFAITGVLLVFFPNSWVYDSFEHTLWYWNWITLGATLVLVILVGGLTRHYFGRKLVEWTDHGIRRVPLLNRVYSTVKQVNESFQSTAGGHSFRQVVLVRYPHAGSLSLGFVTAEPKGEIDTKAGKKMLAVFVPTTPNPTGGFLLFFPIEDLIPLEMSVADGIKFVISLGAVHPSATQPKPGAR